METVADTPKTEQKLLTTSLVETDGATEQQRIFASVYLKTGNTTKAAEAAGYKWPRSNGWNILHFPAVWALVQEGLREKKATAEQIEAELSELCFTSLAYFLDDNGQIDLEKLKANAHLVKSYKCRVNRKLSTDEIEVTDVEIELHDRHAALVDMGKKFKLFAPDVVENTVIVMVSEAAKAELPPEMAGRFLKRLAETARSSRS